MPKDNRVQGALTFRNCLGGDANEPDLSGLHICWYVHTGVTDLHNEVCEEKEIAGMQNPP